MAWWSFDFLFIRSSLLRCWMFSQQFLVCLLKVRQKEHHDSSFHSAGGALLLDESRPMSEASSFGGDETILGAGEVRLRNSRQVQFKFQELNY